MTLMGLQASHPPLDRGFQDPPLPRQRALAVFASHCDLPTLRVLRPGFRHCFCVLGSGSTWTVCDPLKTRLEISTFSRLTEADLASHFHERALLVLVGEVAANQSRRPLRLRALTCVEVVKRALNVDLPAVLTPFQLYHALLALPPPMIPFAAYRPDNPNSKWFDSVHE